MKVKFYLLPFILFLLNRAAAQSCSSLSVNCIASESRCVATGSILVNVSGGSGNYSYKAIGPVTTAITSLNNITGLSPGYYSVIVKDLNTACIKQIDSVQVIGNYDDPRFGLIKLDASCANNDGAISVTNVQYGRSPFNYTIIAPSPSGVGTSNSTGVFSGLLPGEYSIRMQDSCGGIQVRTITIENYTWWFENVSVTRVGCDSADVSITIKDNKNNFNTSSSAFTGFLYGYVIGSDTTWSAAYNFRMFLGTRRSLTIIVKDNCGIIRSIVWNLPANVKPSLNSPQMSNLNCTSFSASVSGQNLTNPQYCIYNNSGNVVACNSTGTFNNLAYSSYCIEAIDLCYDTAIVRCFSVVKPIPAINATVSITNKNCANFTASITGQSNLFNPNYCLYDSNNVQLACNTTGVFNNIAYGSYCITTHDACTDTLISRCFTVTKPLPVLTTYTITGATCSSFNVNVFDSTIINGNYCLYDSMGNLISCDSTGIFTGISQGSYCIRAVSCGDTLNSICFSSTKPVPSVGAVVITNKKCLNFTAYVSGQLNLTAPNYCLYNSSDSLLICNATGVFDSIPYGTYCIKIVNTCYDTTINRCFTVTQPMPSLNSTMQILSRTCNKVSFKINGTNLTAPQYCLYDSLDVLMFCNTTGIFNNQPYGQYCVTVEDNCLDTTLRICQTFASVKGLSLTTSKPCSIGKTYVDVLFANGNSPYNIKVYHPNGSLVYSTNTSTNPLRITLAALPTGTQYKVVGIDSCGNKDSAYIIPDANLVTKSVSVRAKCPGATWLNGTGDINATCTSNFYAVVPKIIKKNGATFIMGFSSLVANTYTFADLEPAQYILEYTQLTCNGKLYDTVTVPPYAYPSQGESALYQCDNNGFSLGADVQGGVSPYSFQIIGSTPSSPSIISSLQSSPIFNINNGTIYSLVRLRTIDACGNATLSDVSVLPLQNIAINASETCFYHNVILSVNTIPNATYLWYKKTTATDSTLIGSGQTYNFPFFLPEEIGLFVCKMVVNGGCVTRLAYFTLDGNCGNVTLPVSIQLKGRKEGKANQLFWNSANQVGVIKYIIERKGAEDEKYKAVGTITVNNNGAYSFNDNVFIGLNLYRLKIVFANKEEYTNVVSLRSAEGFISIYPNPAKDVVHISLSAEKPSDYLIELMNTSGQPVYKREVRNATNTIINYYRNKNIQPGIYILSVRNINTGSTEIYKLLLE